MLWEVSDVGMFKSAAEDNISAVGFFDTQQAFDKSTFARAVFAEDTKVISLVYGEAERTENSVSLIACGKVVAF